MHPFDKDIRVWPAKEGGGYEARISDSWSINTVPNGGYLMAVLANAMLELSPKKGTPIITAAFVSRCLPGHASITVETVSNSQQFARFQAGLYQEGIEKTRVLGTFAKETDHCALTRCESSAPPLPPPADCLEMPPMPGYTLFDAMEIRLDPACAGWMEGRLIDRSEHRGWIRFREERILDIPALLLMADSFPPPVFATQGMVAWVPTLEFSVNIRRPAPPGWVKCIFRSRFITCGLLEEDGQLWSPEGDLIAISRQVAQYRPAS